MFLKELPNGFHFSGSTVGLQLQVEKRQVVVKGLIALFLDRILTLTLHNRIVINHRTFSHFLFTRSYALH